MSARPERAPEAGPRSALLADLPVTERRMDLAGVPTAVLEGGSGSSVVLLHGPGESALWWMRVIPELARRHRVVVPDLPGQGASGLGDGDPLTVDGILSWLDALVEGTCPSPPTLVGHVLGGGIAARYAVSHGDRLRGLVLVDSFGLAPFRPSIAFAFRLLGFSIRPTRGTYDRFLPHCMYDVDAVREAMGDRWEPFIAYNLECAQDGETQAAVRALMPRFALRTIPPEELETISVPTTLIWGRHDRALRLEIAEEASARYGWPLHVIDGARDDPKLERPEAFLEALSSAMEEEARQTR